MSAPADQQTSVDSSVETFTSSIIFNAAITIGLFAVFDLLRKRNKKVYEPRTYLIPEKLRSEPLPSGPFAWALPMLRVPDREVIKRIGLDAYMFIRFMKMWMLLFGIFSLVGLIILLPINSINQKEGSGLDKFTIGNVQDNSNSLWAHVIITWLFSGLTMYALYREFSTFIRLRHEYYTTDEYRHSQRATTILVTGIPNELNDSETLKALFDIYPGGVKRIWLNREPTKLAKATAKRENLVTSLEGAATTYITQHAKDLTKSQSEESNAENGKSASKTKRPQHSDKLPCIGKKVDSLETYRIDLNNLNQTISELQKDPGAFKRLNSVFIQFNDYIGAQLAATSTIPKLNNISPNDVIWENLNLTSNQRMIRRVISLAVVIALVISWAPLVAFVASISTLSELEKLPLFKNIEKLPSAVVGIIQGILPSVGINILMWLLPIILSLISRFEGIVTYSGVGVGVQGKFYFFLVMNVLLITTFANGISQSLPEIIDKPAKTVQILAERLPRAATFFLTYVLLTITTSALEISQLVPLIVVKLKKMLLTKTPRQIWELEKSMTSKDWGTGFPPHILIVSIGLVYSTVQPIILPIATLHFALYFLVYRHQFLYVYQQPHESGGLLFPKGIYQTFVGIYIFQLTLIGLMFLKQGYVQGILCIILFVLSIGVMLAMRKTFKHNPRAEFLPVELMGIVDIKTRKLLVGQQSKTKVNDREKVPLEQDDDVHVDGGDEELELEEGENSFTHPALVAEQPSVWIPNDQNISDGMIDEFKKDGIRATSQGAGLDEKCKVVIDESKVPLEFRNDIRTKNSKGREINQINAIERGIGE